MIKGVTDGETRWPRIGKLRLGERDAQRGFPRALDYFRVDFPDRDLQDLFTEKYGDKPKQITVCFPEDNVESVAAQNYRCYGASSGLKCIGNGETCRRTQVDAGGNVRRVEMQCPTPEHCEFGSTAPNQCKAVMNLRFILPDFPRLAVVQIDTGSWNAIKNVNATIAMLRQLNGRISLIPLELSLQTEQIQAGDKKVTKPILHLDIAMSLRDAAERLRPLLAQGRGLELPPPIDDDRPEGLYENTTHTADGEPVESAEPDEPPDPVDPKRRLKLFKQAREILEGCGLDPDLVNDQLKGKGYTKITDITNLDILDDVVGWAQSEAARVINEREAANDAGADDADGWDL